MLRNLNGVQKVTKIFKLQTHTYAITYTFVYACALRKNGYHLSMVAAVCNKRTCKPRLLQPLRGLLLPLTHPLNNSKRGV